MHIRNIIYTLLTLCIFLPAHAQQICINGLTYHIENEEALLYSGEDCESEISLPEQIFYEGESYPLTTIMRGAFMRNPQLQKIIIPASVTTIGERAFYMCPSLQSVTIAGNLEVLRQETFYYCPLLEEVNIAGLIETRRWVFDGCSSLKRIVLPDNIKILGEGTFAECWDLKEVIMPDGIDEIGSWTFAFTAIDSFIIPKSVDKIGEAIFAGNEDMTYLEVEEGNRVYDSREGCHAIIETALKTLIATCPGSTIPEGVETIGPNAFWGDRHLTDITFPSTLKTIQYRAFGRCENLSDITIPDGVKLIEQEAFLDCTSLATVYLSKKTKVKRNAFPTGCKRIKK